MSPKALLVCAIVMTFFGKAFAATASDSLSVEVGTQTKIYPRSYFDKFNPQSARDLIDRLPGFKLDVGADLRGFGAGAGNVLINGARPSSKAGGVEDALQRLSAENVVRIELVRGAAGSTEAAGQWVVANVVGSQRESDGQWETKLQRASDGRVSPFGALTFTRKFSSWLTSTRIGGSVDRLPLEGSRVTRNAQGAVTFFQEEDSPSTFSEFKLSTGASRDAAGGKLSVNGLINRSQLAIDTERFGFAGAVPTGTPDEQIGIGVDRTVLNGELGADWVRAQAFGWTFKTLGLASFGERDLRQEVATKRPIGVPVSASQFESERKSLETIVRGTANYQSRGRLGLEIGGEATYNRLDSSLALRAADAQGTTNISLPAANVRVTESRGEAFANVIWNPTDKVRLEAGIGAESSTIAVTGDVDKRQSFSFIKPFVTAVYQARPQTQLRMDVRRSVGQLDFGDFAASASASDDRLTAGNPDLGPDQKTRASISADVRSPSWGAANVEVFHEWRDDILEQTNLPSGGQGVGNVGSARFWGIKTDVSLPLTSVISGGLLEVQAEFLDSTFYDPTTLAQRPVSFTDSPSILVQFRQDLPKASLSWGLSYRAPLEGTFFFADEESLNRDGEHWSVFLESTRFWGIKSRFELSGVGGQTFFRERSFFDADRSGDFLGSERISRDRGTFVSLALFGKF